MVGAVFESEVFGVAVSCEVEGRDSLDWGVLIRRWNGVECGSSARGETEPPVVPAAIGHLVFDYSFKPAAANKIRMVGPQNESDFLDIYIHDRNVAEEFSVEAVTDVVYKLIDGFIGACSFAEQGKGKKLVS